LIFNQTCLREFGTGFFNVSDEGHRLGRKEIKKDKKALHQIPQEPKCPQNSRPFGLLSTTGKIVFEKFKRKK
jgi:hypothetical protein